MGDSNSTFLHGGWERRCWQYLVSLLKSQTERDHQERSRVLKVFKGVKADITAFLPISDSRGDSVSKNHLFSGTRK